MTVSEFECIKSKIKQNELSNAAAQGKKETIESNWQKKYGFSTLEEAKAKKTEIEKDIQEKTAKRDELMKQLEESFDWDSI
jgi:ssDNA-binding replication factor A large subunit